MDLKSYEDLRNDMDNVDLGYKDMKSYKVKVDFNYKDLKSYEDGIGREKSGKRGPENVQEQHNGARLQGMHVWEGGTRRLHGALAYLVACMARHHASCNMSVRITSRAHVLRWEGRKSGTSSGA